MNSVELKCQFGSLLGSIENVSTVRGRRTADGGRRTVCMCVDCQAYAHYLGQAAHVLDENCGTDVLPVAPANLKITQSTEHLKSMTLSEKGMLRWYAGCCDRPIANTAPMAKLPFAGVIDAIIDLDGTLGLRDEVLGPIGARVQAKSGIGKTPEDSFPKGSMKLIFQTIGFLLPGLVKRQHAPSPFFSSQTGAPSVTPIILTAAERDALRPLCGPNPQRHGKPESSEALHHAADSKHGVSDGHDPD